MNIEQLYDFCLSKKGVTEHFPFDQDILVFKVGGKIFCLTSLNEWEKGSPSLNLKCDPEKAQQLRVEYNAIRPGYHMNKKHWNTIKYKDDVSDKMIVELINHSYDLVFKSLTQKIQLEISHIKS
ncbi:MmcQ/YjbR family DNA-binding protein [Flavobacterium columnare]|uniref:MmcQ/YjbR family DNA-binding protein n=1 Tax=Flavobacterium columnare TaxID=996 RepID=A0A437UC08_9FLAO|nr:MmcQ/YjbR family DNA-binding protein [Flavobacterium columnare]RVU91162.1 MmcQ/YjbR family DNA-binding protein [Flavobacterium columnare]